jgi:hypothetical protein
MNEELAKFIDQLREAGNQYGAVSDLLDIIESSILIDGLGNKSIVGDADDIEYLKAASIAAAFVRLDRGEIK